MAGGPWLCPPERETPRALSWAGPVPLPGLWSGTSHLCPGSRDGGVERWGVGARGALDPGGNGQSGTWRFPSKLRAWEETLRLQAVFRCMIEGR